MGNVYMEADQVRFKDSTYRNLQIAVSAALEGGGGGGTTVVANPEGSATADLSKLQVGTTIYGIPAEAGDISYDNTSSGLTADDVQEAIDELNTGIGGISELIPSDATSSNKLATADDIPDAVAANPGGAAEAGDLSKLQIGDNIYNIPSAAGTVTDYSYVVNNVSFTANTWVKVSEYTALSSGIYALGVFPSGGTNTPIASMITYSSVSDPSTIADADKNLVYGENTGNTCNSSCFKNLSANVKTNFFVKSSASGTNSVRIVVTKLCNIS